MRWCCCAFLVIFATSLICAQEAAAPPPGAQEKQHRPTIGLVLEGGGALGLAHVGVLRWFEEHHIPVDYVAGTSMGGLVGGLYASGRSATQMLEFVKTVDWNKALSNETPYRAESFRRKEDRRDYPSKIEFGLKHGVSFPSGFNSGHQVGLILDRIALPYSDLKSFDDLPTPFRCVATDLVSGKSVVFDRGSLADALRATMSLPGVFSPVRRDDQVLVDGGLLKNLPVDVARAMGADIVIAVHLKVKPLDPKKPLSAFGVLGQSVTVVIAANELASMQKADVLIPVHTEAFSSTDYQASDKLIQLGYEGAQERAKLLERFSVSDQEWNEYEAARKARTRPVPAPQFVEVTGPPSVISEGIANSLANDIGKPVDYKKLDHQLTEITGLGRFSRAGYQLVSRGDQEGLLIHAEEKDYAPPLVVPSFLIDGSDYNNVLFSLGARITLLDIGGFGSELRNDVVVGAQYGLASEYYHPLHWKSHLFVAPRGFANSLPFDIYLDNNRIAEYRERNLGGGADFGIAIDRFSELRFGYQIGQVSLKRDVGVPDFQNGSGRQAFTRLQYLNDHLDNPTVPRQGYYVKYGFRFYDANLGATENFPMTELQTQIFQRISQPGSVFLLASGGTTFGYEGTGLPPFSLGGPRRLAAYGTNELLPNQYFLFQPGYLHRIKKLSPLVGGSISLFGMYEVAKAYNAPLSPNEPSVPQDFNGGLLIQTPLGPLVFGGAVGNGDHHKFYFLLGRYF
jgi:NTE family protein